MAHSLCPFMKMNGVKHSGALPYRPVSKGAVETLIQTFKKAMTASNCGGTTISQWLASFLLFYRTTSHSTINATPAELFMKRMLWARLDLIYCIVECSVNAAQGVQKVNYDKIVKFVIGLCVMV